MEINRRFLKGIEDLELEGNPQASKLIKEVENLDAFVRNNGLSINQTLTENSIIVDIFIFFFYLVKTINRLLFVRMLLFRRYRD